MRVITSLLLILFVTVNQAGWADAFNSQENPVYISIYDTDQALPDLLPDLDDTSECLLSEAFTLTLSRSVAFSKVTHDVQRTSAYFIHSPRAPPINT